MKIVVALALVAAMKGTLLEATRGHWTAVFVPHIKSSGVAPDVCTAKLHHGTAVASSVHAVGHGADGLGERRSRGFLDVVDAQ